MKSFILLLIFALASPQALSCFGPQPFKNQDKKNASVVLKAEIVGYSLISETKATLKFKVLEQIKGSADHHSATLATNTDTSIPKNLIDFKKCYTQTFEIGFVQNDNILNVLQGPCGHPYILPLTKGRPTICPD